MGGSSKGGSATIYQYYASMMLALCWGKVERIHRVIYGDKLLMGTSKVGSTIFNVDHPEFFGGDKKEGGAKGSLLFMDGDEKQRLHPDLAARMYPGVPYDQVPGYRGISCLALTNHLPAAPGYPLAGAGVLHYLNDTTFAQAIAGNMRGNWASYAASGLPNGFHLSTNAPYIKTIAVEVSRPSDGWYPEKSRIYRNPATHADYVAGANPANIEGRYDSNGIHVLYEMFVNTDWGMGAPAWSLDHESFRRAADIIFDERIGLSFRWREQMTFESFSQMLVDHLRVAVFPHPRTGLTTVVCLRGDYEINDLLVLDRTNSKLISTTVRENADVVNEILVKWTNPDTNEDETVYSHDLASIARMGETVSETHSYKLYRRHDLAEEAASRDVFLKTAQIRSATVKPSPRFKTFAPSDVVLINFPEDGIFNIPMRIMNVILDDDDDTQQLELGEDIFSEVGVAAGEGVVGNRPEVGNNEITGLTISSAPYYMTRQYGITPEPDSEYFMFIAPVADSSTYVIDVSREVTQRNGEVELVEVAEIGSARVGNIDDAIPFQMETTITIPSNISPGQPIRKNAFAIIGLPPGDEVCLITNVVGNQITLRRGCLDTKPRAWSANAPIAFMASSGDYMLETEFATGVSVEFTLSPTSLTGADPVIAVGTGTLIDRCQLPLRPANVFVNGVRNQSTTVAANGSGNFVITWATRNRLTEDNAVLAWSEGGVGGESGVATRAVLKDASGNVLDSNIELIAAGTTLSSGAYSGIGVIEVYAERGNGDTSYQKSVFNVTM